MIDAKELWTERLRQEMSRGQLAKKVGRHRDTIKDWETGRFAPSNFLDYIRWCRALDMDQMTTIDD